jgi:7-carboxy-7-deazaguanine synthase
LSRSQTLRITEIFFSLQGETKTVGLPTVFVRLTGCPLRCTYCDTAYAFSGGTIKTLDEIIDQVRGFGARFVTVTGGEPLAQPGCIPLLTALCDEGFDVSLETSGALPVKQVDSRVMKVLDIKTPGSGEVERNLWDNLSALNARDQIKFVITSREDYDWTRDQITDYGLDKHCEVLVSPSYGECDYQDLAEWVLADRLPVRYQVQLHKIVWGDKPGT